MESCLVRVIEFLLLDLLVLVLLDLDLIVTPFLGRFFLSNSSISLSCLEMFGIIDLIGLSLDQDLLGDLETYEMVFTGPEEMLGNRSQAV